MESEFYFLSHAELVSASIVQKNGP